MALYQRGKRRCRAPGFTRCRRCRLIVDNAELVEVVKQGNSHGMYVCAVCAIRMCDGPARHPSQSR